VEYGHTSSQPPRCLAQWGGTLVDRFRDAAASGLTDRRSAAHTALSTVSASREPPGPQNSLRTSRAPRLKGGDLAAPRVHRQPRGHRHQDGAPVRLCLSRDWPFSALPGMPGHEADLVRAQPGQAARSRHRCAPRPAATPVQHIESTAGIRRFRNGITLSSERVQRERARSRRSGTEYGRRGTPVMSRRTDGPEICLSHDLPEVLLL